ncbi:MAG TPA: hypothetical protein GX507_06650 [Clostridia bacterium]|nr:hypothetical protein [Clostridia bacterium]
MLALVKGEADAYMGSESVVANLVQTGDLKGLVLVQKSGRGQILPDVPSLSEAFPEGEELADMMGQMRVLAAPPGTPEGTMKVLREALKSAMANQEMLSKAREAQIPINYDTAEEALRIAQLRVSFAEKYRDAWMPAYEKK